MDTTTALLIIAGLILVIYIWRAKGMPTDEKLRAEVEAIKAERDYLRNCLNEMGDYLHTFGHPAQAERVQEVLKRQHVEKPETERERLGRHFAERENWD